MRDTVLLPRELRNPQHISFTLTSHTHKYTLWSDVRNSFVCFLRKKSTTKDHAHPHSHAQTLASVVVILVHPLCSCSKPYVWSYSQTASLLSQKKRKPWYLPGSPPLPLALQVHFSISTWTRGDFFCFCVSHLTKLRGGSSNHLHSIEGWFAVTERHGLIGFYNVYNTVIMRFFFFCI